MKGTLAFLLFLPHLLLAEARGPAVLKPEPVESASRSWAFSQFLAADKKGNLFLLDGDALEVYPLLPSGELGKPSRLERDPQEARKNPTFKAAMSADGDAWAVLEGFRPRLWVDGREVPVEWPDYCLQAIAFSGSDLVAVSQPMASPRRQPPAPDPEAPLPDPFPWLVVWNGKSWETLVGKDLGDRPGLRSGKAAQEQLLGELFGDHKGKLWLMPLYQHRFQQVSSGGKRLTEIVVGKGEVESLPDPKGRQGAMEKSVGAWKKDLPKTARMDTYAVTARRVTSAGTEGRDGLAYFLVAGTGADGAGAPFALERYDAAAGKMERIGLEMPTGGASLAAGKDGLFIAPFRAKDGLWRISWTTLAETKWGEVRDARISGSASAGEAGAAP
jgi:hypothetical protein